MLDRRENGAIPIACGAFMKLLETTDEPAQASRFDFDYPPPFFGVLSPTFANMDGGR